MQLWLKPWIPSGMWRLERWCPGREFSAVCFPPGSTVRWLIWENPEQCHHHSVAFEPISREVRSLALKRLGQEDHVFKTSLRHTESVPKTWGLGVSPTYRVLPRTCLWSSLTLAEVVTLDKKPNKVFKLIKCGARDKKKTFLLTFFVGSFLLDKIFACLVRQGLSCISTTKRKGTHNR